LRITGKAAQLQLGNQQTDKTHIVPILRARRWIAWPCALPIMPTLSCGAVPHHAFIMTLAQACAPRRPLATVNRACGSSRPKPRVIMHFAPTAAVRRPDAAVDLEDGRFARSGGWH